MATTAGIRAMVAVAATVALLISGATTAPAVTARSDASVVTPTLPPYRLVDLGTLPGGRDSEGVAVNDLGFVIGNSDRGEFMERHGFIWHALTSMRDLGDLGGGQSTAWAINRVAQVTGCSTAASDQTDHPFLWSPLTRRMVDLSGGAHQGCGVAINNAGEVAGWTVNDSGLRNPFFWSRRTGLVDLGSLGGPDAVAFGLNNRGEVLGVSSTANGELRPFLWTRRGGMRDIGGRHGLVQASAINDRGVVSGSALGADGVERAAVWSAPGGVRDLGVRGPGTSGANSINNRGTVAVARLRYDDASTLRFAGYRWTRSTGLQQLPAAPGDDTSVGDLNEQDQAVGLVLEAGIRGIPVVWSTRAGVRRLPTRGGINGNYAVSINLWGMVAGQSLDRENRTHAVVWVPTIPRRP